MSNFDGPLIIEFDRKASDELGGDYWRVKKSFRYALPERAGNEWTTYEPKSWAFVPAGMLTDLGTIPKLARAVVDRDGRAAQAFVLHDQLCEYLSITTDGVPERITRKEADAILYSAMRDLGVREIYVALVQEFVDLYREFLGTRLPSTTARKRALEAQYNFEDLL